MKYKILSAVIATALLNGCGGSNPSTTVQAYDPAIAYMNATYTCTDDDGAITSESDDAGLTDGYGNVVISDSTFALNTETCELTFEPTPESVDVSTGKSMSDLTLKVPRGMATNGGKVTGSPASTFLYDALGGADYDEATATQVLTDLGLGPLLTNGVDILDLLLDPQGVAESDAVSDTDKSRLLATLSASADTIRGGGSVETAKAIADAILAETPEYPVSDTGETVYYPFDQSLIDATEAGDPVVLPDTEEAEPLDPETLDPVATGGTGGTGATGGTGGAGI